MEVSVGMSLRGNARKGKIYDFAENLLKTDAADHTSKKK